jgi:hypothetical protein
MTSEPLPVTWVADCGKAFGRVSRASQQQTRFKSFKPELKQALTRIAPSKMIGLLPSRCAAIAQLRRVVHCAKAYGGGLELASEHAASDTSPIVV